MPALLIFYACLSLQLSGQSKHLSDNILILNSYHLQYSWTARVNKGISDGLAEFMPREHIYEEFLDTRRHPDDPYYLSKLHELYQYKYKEIDIAAVIVSDDYGLDFLLQYRDSLFPSVPVVFCGINNYDESLRKYSDFLTGIFEGTEIPGNIELIRTMHPETERVLILTDQSSFGQGLRAQAEEAIAHQPNGIQFEIWDDYNFSEMLEYVETLDNNTVIFILSIIFDNRGNYFSYEEHLPLLAEAASVPIYGMWGIEMGNGITGGVLNNAYNHGRAAAGLAVRILMGENPSDIPMIPKSVYSPVFDYALIKRFQLDESRMPQGTVIYNKPVTLFERYKYWIMGTFFFICLETALVVYLSISRTLLRKMNLLIRKNQIQLRFILEGTSLGLWEYDPDAESFQFTMRDCFFRPIPQQAQTLPYGVYLQWIYKEDKPRFRRYLEDLLQKETAYQELEFRILDNAGNMKWLISRGRRGDNEDKGKVSGIIADITERKKTDSLLFQTQKMDSIGTLANGLAHDFNNILTGISNSVILMNNEIRKNDLNREKMAQYLDMVVHSSEKAGELIRELKDISSKKESPLMPVNLSAAVENVTRICRSTFPKNIRIETALSHPEALILSDASRVEQIVLNLCINAGHAMTIMQEDIAQQGGTLKVSLEQRFFGQSLLAAHPEVRSDDPFWRLSIADAGIGMDQEVLRKLFEPFYTANKPNGTGMGLYMVYKIVKEHKGYIDVLSTPGEGTEFQVYFPVYSQDDPAPEPPGESSMGGTGGKPA